MKQHCHDEHVRVVVRPRCAVLAVHLVDLLAVVAGVGAPPAEQHEVWKILACWCRHMMVKSVLRFWTIWSITSVHFFRCSSSGWWSRACRS
ncbi:hypothetical protein OsJ_15969 [Oryza sativa Japonica Group]|uniref:Secreted protein n=1 Tax=Oryza sativa subsp. japonica TaxID=39947 RepID=B9FC80_ORYSJ|nr:hypothetical protein OsJ_15969 [Oryza sativa Japonica Group]